ncbi:MAG: mRNA surveillance protein pelota [Desulfurococcales archaeon]|nr:mRNA surveillance protein pelota [Desulfurococcales archaeon]
MKVVFEDLRKGVVKVRVECADDLWVLKTVVSEGDVIIARTLRDVKIDGEGKRRLPMVVAIRVKNIYFQPFATRLRIHGVIVDAPDGYGLKGSHHTLNIDVGTEVSIIKESWSKSQLKRLRRASERWVNALLLAADFDEVSVAIIYGQGVKYLIDRSLPGVSSRDPNSLERIVDCVVELALSVLAREKVRLVVVGSPAFLKDLIAKKLSSQLPRNQGIRLYVDSVSSGGRAGISELIRRDVVKNLLREVSAVEAEEVLEEFMMLLSKKPERVAYGLESVKLAVEANAVSKLLVSEELLSGGNRETVEEVLSTAESRGALVRIVPTETPASVRLKALGGIIAVLRYDFDTHSIRA